MNAIQAQPMRVGFASPLESDVELLEAARQATRTLDRLVKENDLESAARELMWGVSSELPASYVSPVLTERDEYGTRTASRLITRNRLLDPVLRDSNMIELLLDVRGQRRKQIGEIVRRGVDALEDEEVVNG